MPFLSLLKIRADESRWMFLQAYELHQLLWKAFPGIETQDEVRLLYRHDPPRIAGDGMHVVLVQSRLSPDWSFMHEVEGCSVKFKSFAPETIQNGTSLRFFLRANPVVRRRGYDDGRSRHILVGSDRSRMATRLGMPLEELPDSDAQLIAWLLRKAQNCGFSLIECTPGPATDYLIRRSPLESRDRSITLTGIDFQGVLRVDDPVVFASAVTSGIGRGKAFGFGLLSIASII